MTINVKLTTLMILSTSLLVLSSCATNKEDDNRGFGGKEEIIEKYKIQKDDVRGDIVTISDYSVRIKVTEVGKTNKDSMLSVGNEVVFNVLDEDKELFDSKSVDGIKNITFSVPVGTAATRSLPPQISSANIVDIQN